MEEPAAYAFRMFLNYDGESSAFGETSISAQSADQEKLAVYAAQRASDGALTLVVINKTSRGLTSSVALKNAALPGSAQVYRYSADDLEQIVRQPDLALDAAGFTSVFPAQSITLVVIQ